MHFAIANIAACIQALILVLCVNIMILTVIWLTVLQITCYMYLPPFLENALKSGRQVALGSNPWEHLDDDLYLIRLGLYQAAPARANLASLSSQFSQCI